MFGNNCNCGATAFGATAFGNNCNCGATAFGATAFGNNCNCGATVFGATAFAAISFAAIARAATHAKTSSAAVESELIIRWTRTCALAFGL